MHFAITAVYLYLDYVLYLTIRSFKVPFIGRDLHVMHCSTLENLKCTALITDSNTALPHMNCDLSHWVVASVILEVDEAAHERQSCREL